MNQTIHITRIDRNGGVYGHEADYCDDAGCAGDYRGCGELVSW